MDTRQKILTLQEAVDGINRSGKLTVIIGHFDPLTAAHARRLTELHPINGSLAVIVTDPPHPILPQRARAELVAALRTVDYVVAAVHNTSAEIVARLHPDTVNQEEMADLRRTQDLIAHVHRRQVAKEA